MTELSTTNCGGTRESLALVRGRQVRGAGILLRLILAYAVCDWSLRLVGAWAAIQGLAFVSDVALLYRFRQSQRFVGMLVLGLLQQRNTLLTQRAGVRLRLVDATVISQPGSQGTDWRLHASLDLATCAWTEWRSATRIPGKAWRTFRYGRMRFMWPTGAMPLRAA